MGGALIALLFFADWYMPPLSAEPNRAGIDKSIIRIHSLHKWPEAVVFDTSLPTIIPPPVVAAELPVMVQFTKSPANEPPAELLPAVTLLPTMAQLIRKPDFEPIYLPASGGALVS